MTAGIILLTAIRLAAAQAPLLEPVTATAAALRIATAAAAQVGVTTIYDPSYH